MGNREQVLADCKLIYETLADLSELDNRISELTDEIKIVSEMALAQVKQHASQAESEEAYAKRRAALVARFDKANAELEQKKVDRQLHIDQRNNIKRFIDLLKKQPLVLPEWDEQLWSQIVESIQLYHDSKATVRFVRGIEIEVSWKC